MISTRDWLRSKRLLHSLSKRMDKLEAKVEVLQTAVFHGNCIVSILVPSDLSPEEEWFRVTEGNPSSRGKRHFVLVDRNGNLLKVIR